MSDHNYRHPVKTIVIFDGSCDFCTAIAELLRRLDRRRRLTCLPFQIAGLPERYGLSVRQCEESVWTILPDGRRYRGAQALASILDLLTGFPLWQHLYHLPGLGPLSEHLYRWVAAHRQYLPGVRPYCQRPRTPCGAAHPEPAQR